MAQVSLSEFASKVSKVMPVIIKEFAKQQTNELYKGKLTLPQFLILDFLDKKTESKMTDLANFLAVTTAAMTGIIDKLVNYGYVKRVADSNDRRIIKIKLTAKGTELVKRINQQRHKMLIEIFGKVSPVERESYLKVLLHIHDILSEQKPDTK